MSLSRLMALAAALIVWSPTAWSQTVVSPDSITQTAGSAFFPAVNLINGSGLSAAPNFGNFATVTHAVAGGGTAWVTDAPGGGAADYFALDPVLAPLPTFTLTFPLTYDFTNVLTWGYHFGAPNGNEVSEFTLEFSTDGGLNYSAPTTISRTLSGPAVDNQPLGATFSANTIRMTMTDNFFEDAGGGDRAGLGEVAFIVDQGVLNLNVNRDTGEILFANESPIAYDIAGFGITSVAGGLDPNNWNSISSSYDQGAAGGISADEWVEFSATSFDLSEGTLGTGTIAPGQILSLGVGTWIQTPFEDLVAVYLDANTGDVVQVPVIFEGNLAADPLTPGDYNGNGVVDAADWPTYRNGYRADLTGLSPVEAYLLGDLNGDGVNNAVDFGIFKSNWEVDNPGMSFANMISGAAVPEPSAAVLFALSALAGCWLSRKRLAKLTVAAGAALAVLLCAADTHAVLPSLVSNWTLDADATDAAGANNGTAANVTFGAAGANANTGSSATFNGTSSTITVPFSADLNPDSFTVAFWARPTATNGFRSPITSRDDFMAGVSTHGYITYIDPDGNWEFWTGDGDPGWATIDAGPVAAATWTHVAIAYDGPAGVKSFYLNGDLALSVIGQGYSPNGTLESEALHIGSGSDTGTSFFFEGDIDDVAVFSGVLAPAEIQNIAANSVANFELQRLELVVNSANGAAFLRTTNGSTFAIDQYEILSDSGSLLSTNWDSIANNGQAGLPQGNGTGNGWEILGTPTDNFVGEGYLQDTSLFSGSTTVPLGQIFDLSGSQDLQLFYRDATGALIEGVVTYATISALQGDFNGDGVVDAADYTVWRDNLGAPNESAFATGTGNGGGIDASDYALWRSQFGMSSTPGALADSAAAVPEPSTTLLLLAAGAMAVVASRRWKLALPARQILAFGTIAWAVAGSAAWAVVTNDRLYLFGEGFGEAGANNQTVGAANTLAPGFTLDEIGPSNAFLDLQVFGTPTYVDVGPSGLNRPLADADDGEVGNPVDLGVRFTGTGQHLRGLPLNRPDELAAIVQADSGVSYPINYAGITGRGIQLWVYPTAASLGSAESPTTFQSIVFDSIFSGGPAINEFGRWTQINSFHGATSEGIAVPATVDVPAGDTWYHVMHHNYINGAAGSPRIVPGFTDIRGFTSVMYVDGVVVSANNDNVNTGGDPAFVGRLVVGASEVAGDGISIAIDNHYNGVVDNLEMYVYGNNETGTPGNLADGENWGTFSLFADNEWIANQIATTVPGGVLLPGDVNKDGVVNGDGSGDPASDDVAAFVLGWGSRNVIPGFHSDVTAGDWLTWEAGDFNHDGITDFADWFLLRANHPSPASLNLANLLAGAAVPEPASVALLLVALGGLSLRLRR